jgi:hypothetical protein
MFNLILIIAFIGAIVISAVFAGVTFLQGVQSSVDMQITRQRLIEVANELQVHARYVDGQIALPAGSTGSSPYAYNQVPSWVSNNARNANGVPFVYCPYKSSAGTGSSTTITMPSGSTYAIETTSNATTNSQPYVVDSDAPDADAPSGTLGILIAASPNNFNPPDCDDISAASDGTIIVTGGIAVPIQNNYVLRGQVATAGGEVRYYVAPTASGLGNGRDQNSPMLLDDALAAIKTLKPASAVIVFAQPSTPTTYTTTETLSYGTRILLIGAGVNTIVEASSFTIDEDSYLALFTITLQSTAGDIEVRGKLDMDSTSNVTTPSGYKLFINGGIVNMLTSTVPTYSFTGNITIDGGGRLRSQGTTYQINGITNRGLKVTNGAIEMHSGTLRITPASSGIVPVYFGAGGTMTAISYLDINYADFYDITGGIVIDPGGKLFTGLSSVSTTIRKATDYGIYVHGDFNSEYSPVLFSSVGTGGLDYGIVLASGGFLRWGAQSGRNQMIGDNTATASQKPSIGVYDNGGSLLATSNTANTAISPDIFALSDCWHGRSGTNLFTDAAAGTSNAQYSMNLNTAGLTWFSLYNASRMKCNL